MYRASIKRPRTTVVRKLLSCDCRTALARLELSHTCGGSSLRMEASALFRGTLLTNCTLPVIVPVTESTVLKCATYCILYYIAMLDAWRQGRDQRSYAKRYVRRALTTLTFVNFRGLQLQLCCNAL